MDHACRSSPTFSPRAWVAWPLRQSWLRRLELSRPELSARRKSRFFHVSSRRVSHLHLLLRPASQLHSCLSPRPASRLPSCWLYSPLALQPPFWVLRACPQLQSWEPPHQTCLPGQPLVLSRARQPEQEYFWRPKALPDLQPSREHPGQASLLDLDSTRS